jgi:hypothetical protein
MSTSNKKTSFIPQIYIAGHAGSRSAAFGADFDRALMRDGSIETLCGKHLDESTALD